MIRYIPLFLCIVLLSGCKELYFISPQPRGGKYYEGDLKQYLTSIIPKVITSNDNNSLLRNALNDTLTYIEINQDSKTAQIKMRFYNDLIWVEEFDQINQDLDDLFSDMDLNQTIILEKENIICVNQKTNDNYYKIDFILESNRNNRDIIFHFSPFLLDSDDFDMLLGRKIGDFNLNEHYDDDSTKFYTADPSYMSFRWLLNQSIGSNDFMLSQSFTNIWVEELFNEFESRVKLDSTKYRDIIGLLNFKSF